MGQMPHAPAPTPKIGRASGVSTRAAPSSRAVSFRGAGLVERSGDDRATVLGAFLEPADRL